MGQKANLLTIRNFKQDINLTVHNSKIFANLLEFLNFWDSLLQIKGIWVSKKTMNVLSNICYINLELFYRSSKTNFYKKKGIQNSLTKNNLLTLNNRSLDTIFFNHLNFLNVNLINFSVKNLNCEINSKAIAFFYNKTKRFVNTLFSRRFNLFIDFLKISSLFCQNKIDAKQYLFLLSTVFRALAKRSHSRFFFFIKYLFKIMIYEYPLLNLQDTNLIHGIKFVINGKLQGKTRATFSLVQEGSVPIQSFNKNVDFAKGHTYTSLGAFGLRIWVFKK